MLYAIARKDGGVSIMNLLPVRIGEHIVARISQNGDMFDVYLEGRNKIAVPLAAIDDGAPCEVALTFPDAEDEAKKTGLDYVSVTRIRRADLPQDRTFRNAWNADLTCDMKKARDIHRDCIRAARKPMLDALDVEYQRADEAGDNVKKREIAAKKQKLRDATKHPGIDAAQTPDALKAVSPL